MVHLLAAEYARRVSVAEVSLDRGEWWLQSLAMPPSPPPPKTFNTLITRTCDTRHLA